MGALPPSAFCQARFRLELQEWLDKRASLTAQATYNTFVAHVMEAVVKGSERGACQHTTGTRPDLNDLCPGSTAGTTSGGGNEHKSLKLSVPLMKTPSECPGGWLHTGSIKTRGERPSHDMKVLHIY